MSHLVVLCLYDFQIFGLPKHPSFSFSLMFRQLLLYRLLPFSALTGGLTVKGY